MHKIFIDGQAGTTGLQIHDRLSARADIELLSIPDDHRKKTTIKKDIISQSDVVILCLPDAAAIETVRLAQGTAARLLDASSAHRTHPDWVYGLPELAPGQREKIAKHKFVSNPGCYPTGFLLAIAPLAQSGKLKTHLPFSISAVCGYSGGGHNMIDKYQKKAHAAKKTDNLWCSRPYALDLSHKHLPEMRHFAGLDQPPLFMPSVGHYKQGMLVSTPLSRHYFNGAIDLDTITNMLKIFYANETCVTVHGPNIKTDLEQGFLDPQANNGTNRNDIYVFGNDEQYLLVSQLDNLGKGAAGAAVQNLNLMLGKPELSGLTLMR